MNLRVWFNPNCSKCRNLKALLEERGIQAEYRHYLEQGPSLEELEGLVQKLAAAGTPADQILPLMLRSKDPAPDGFDLADQASCLAAIVADPSQLQRPIVESDQGAVVARPPELVNAFLS